MEWFAGITERDAVLFCRATQQGFLRLLTNAAVLTPYGNPPLTNAQAWSAYAALMDDDRVGFRGEEPAGIEDRWCELAIRDTASPKLWTDAYLAAFASSAGLRLVTTDAAFRQFGEVDLLLLG
jgi:toxin-antitoxin system PIN domain toxin